MFLFLKRNNKQEEQPTMPNFEEILAAIEKLSDEEKKQIHEKTGDDVAAPETTTEEVAKAKEEGEDKYLALKKDHENLRAEFEALKQQFAEAQSKPREVDKDEAKKLDDIRRTYLN